MLTFVSFLLALSLVSPAPGAVTADSAVAAVEGARLDSVPAGEDPAGRTGGRIDSLLSSPAWGGDAETRELYRAFFFGTMDELIKTARKVLGGGGSFESRALALEWLCQFYFAEGNYGAISDLLSSSRLARGVPGYRSARRWLALSSSARGDFAAAIKIWKDLLEERGLSAEEKASYLYGIALALEKQGRLEEAVSYYRKVYSLGSDTSYAAQALLRAGLDYYKMDEYDLGALHLQEFLARYPAALGSSIARRRLGELEARAASTAAQADTVRYTVLLGIFAVKKDGESLLARLRGAGFSETDLRVRKRGRRIIYTVTAGDFADPGKAAGLADRIARVFPVSASVVPIEPEESRRTRTFSEPADSLPAQVQPRDSTGGRGDE